MTLQFVRRSFASVCAALVVAACTSSNNNNTGPSGPTAAELAGSYNLVTFTFPTCPSALGPNTSPAATGTLTLAAGSGGAPNTYDSQIAIPAAQGSCPTSFNDVGTFTVSNGVWNQTSTTQGGQQFQGTVALTAGGQLTINLNTAIGSVATVWQRQ